MKNLILLAGHGFSNTNKGIVDVGAVAQDGTTEREIVVAVAKSILEKIKIADNLVHIGVFENKNLSSKIKDINNICTKNLWTAKDTLLVELHIDWREASDRVVAYYGNTTGNAQRTEKLCKSVALDTGVPFGWVKLHTASPHGQLGIIAETIPSAIVLELGSLNVSGTQRLLRDTDKIANAIIRGLQDIVPLEIEQKEHNAQRIINLAKGIERLRVAYESEKDEDKKINILKRITNTARRIGMYE